MFFHLPKVIDGIKENEDVSDTSSLIIVLLLQFVVNLIADRFQPFVALLTSCGYVSSQMLEPEVTLCAVPMLHLVRDVDNHAWLEFYRLLAPFLIPAAAGDTNEYLVCAVMDVPVVAAGRLEGDIGITGNS